MKAITSFFGKIFQLKVSFIGLNGLSVWAWGTPYANFKLAEVSVALLSFGVRITVRV